jgi:Ricin-type beta-trefoil lectin domain
MLRNRGSGKCLADPDSNTTNGTRVVISSCNGYRNQVWTLPAGPVASQMPGKCLDDSGNQTADGTKVDIWTCDGSAGQAWTVTAGGTVTVHGKCLDVAGSGTTSGTPVDLHTCDGSPGQQWRLIPNGAGATLRNPQSGLCLADPADASSDGTQLQIQACSLTDPGQAWRVS